MKKQPLAPQRMKYSPLTLSRSHVLGEYYKRCERLPDPISVYLDNTSGELLGNVDESLGKYADAFTFHLSEEVCKMLAGGKFDYSFGYHFTESDSDATPSSRRRIQLDSVFLTERPTAEKPPAIPDVQNPTTTTDQPLADQPLSFAATD